MAKNTVETAIRNAASSKLAGKYNLPSTRKRERHTMTSA